MDIRFCIQDPTHPETTYLYEAIITAAINATAWHGVFAFASRDGVNQLIEDPILRNFMAAGGVADLLVGIDAVTNRATLELLQDIGLRHAQFRPKIFWNETHGLFHPKLSDFRYRDGSHTLIVGSGNLTPGGLTSNFEAYTVISADHTEKIDVSALNGFVKRHAERIRDIDDEALERAGRNLFRHDKGVEQRGSAKGVQRPRITGKPPATKPDEQFGRVLIAHVPRAGERWPQVHFNSEVVREYFHISNHQIQRAYLTHVDASGIRADVEVRPCVYSLANKNHKIEIGAARGLSYPEDGPPLLVLRERQLRTFDYMLLIPGQDGYNLLLNLSMHLPTLGRGLPRVITDLMTLEGVWPTSPLLVPEYQNGQEI